MLSHRHTSNRALLVILTLLLLAAVVLSTIWHIVSSGSTNTTPGKITHTPCPVMNFPSKSSTGVQPPLYLGLDAYRHIDKLAYLEVGDRVMGQSTADLAGSNTDNVHHLRILPNGERVLFDQSGPGLVTFLRMQEDYGGPWNLSLDGRFTTTIGTGDPGQINPASDPAQAFPYPLSLNPHESQGSSIIASAIPFQQSMLWTSIKNNGNFYT